MTWPVLTSEEKRVLIFILAALLLGWGTKSYRDSHPARPLHGQNAADPSRQPGRSESADEDSSDK